MARPRKSDTGMPTISTSYKLSAKHRFALHLLARQGGTTYTAVLEDAVDELAKSKLNLPKHWLELYDPEPSMRMLRAFAISTYKATSEEDEMIAFIRAHPQFWWADKDHTEPKRQYVTVLWPERERYIKIWRGRDKNYWAAAEAMAADLKKAKIEPPKFGDK